ncbi:MAG TPA: PilZ domain-containing protein [Gammaproteobacteria bacterium]|nr:PilZ domain-containing protein [Gammaproteobacteria bacterium]
MEHRMNVRIPLHMEVGIEFPGSAFITGHTGNMSFEGMYVRTGNTGLPRHGLVKVEFVIHGPQEHAHLRVPALVVRTTPEGVGLMFGNCDEDIFEGIARLLEQQFNAAEGRTPRTLPESAGGTTPRES